jgi:hypothetical protein
VQSPKRAPKFCFYCDLYGHRCSNCPMFIKLTMEERWIHFFELDKKPWSLLSVYVLMWSYKLQVVPICNAKMSKNENVGICVNFLDWAPV